MKWDTRAIFSRSRPEPASLRGFWWAHFVSILEEDDTLGGSWTWALGWSKRDGASLGAASGAAGSLDLVTCVPAALRLAVVPSVVHTLGAA